MAREDEPDVVQNPERKRYELRLGEAVAAPTKPLLTVSGDAHQKIGRALG